MLALGLSVLRRRIGSEKLGIDGCSLCGGRGGQHSGRCFPRGDQPRGQGEEIHVAGLPEGGKDTCQGDSGPFLVMSPEKPFILAGATSWGVGVPDQVFPGSTPVFPAMVIGRANTWCNHRGRLEDLVTDSRSRCGNSGRESVASG